METTGSVNKYSESVASTDQVVTSLLQGHQITGAIINDNEEIEKYNKFAKQVLGSVATLSQETNGLTVEEYHQKMSSEWLIPDKYKRIDIEEHLLSLCKSPEETSRVKDELVLYKEYNLYDALKMFVYLVDVMRKNEVIWGVGRGSSVSSHCLYLLGVHKINSLKYNLDIREFLK